MTLIYNYLKSLPKYRKIKIFYDTRYENPFKIKFPFISCFEDLDKRREYLHEMNVLNHRNKVGKNENDNQPYEGESLYKKYHKLINLLYKRIDIEYYKRKQNKFECYNTEKFHHRNFIPNFDLMTILFNSDSDKDSDSDNDKDIDTDTDTDTDNDNDKDSDKDKERDIDTDTDTD